MKKQNYIILTALSFSLFVYVFYRTEKTVVNEILVYFISLQTYLEIKAWVVTSLPLGEIIVYSLPEGLWVFCITITSRSFYIQSYNRRIDFAIIPLIYSIGLELTQLMGVTRGRFDQMDIALIVVFWVVARFGFVASVQKQNLIAHVNSRTLTCFASYGVVYLSHVLE